MGGGIEVNIFMILPLPTPISSVIHFSLINIVNMGKGFKQKNIACHMVGCTGINYPRGFRSDVTGLGDGARGSAGDSWWRGMEKLAELFYLLLCEGNMDLSDLLSRMDDKIAKVRELAHSRKDILDKVEKWKHAAVEESWLDEYEQDGNRYSAGKGAHKNLKRAEKARLLVNKIPSLLENLILKVKTWEMEKGMSFLYDKAPLLLTLEEYSATRGEKEEDKRKSREQKRLQEQQAMEQEAIYGSKPPIKKPLSQNTSANANYGTPINRRIGTPARHVISIGKERKENGRFGNVAPVVNYVALPKDDPRG